MLIQRNKKRLQSEYCTSGRSPFQIKSLIIQTKNKVQIERRLFHSKIRIIKLYSKESINVIDSQILLRNLGSTIKLSDSQLSQYINPVGFYEIFGKDISRYGNYESFSYGCNMNERRNFIFDSSITSQCVSDLRVDEKLDLKPLSFEYPKKKEISEPYFEASTKYIFLSPLEEKLMNYF